MSHDYMSWANYVMSHEMNPVAKLEKPFDKSSALPSPTVQVFLPQEKLPVSEEGLREALSIPVSEIKPPAL